MPTEPPASTPARADPRSELERTGERDIRPAVVLPGKGISGAAIAVIAGVAALGLFAALEARRQAGTAPATTRVITDLGAPTAPPPLYLPEPTRSYEPIAARGELPPPMRAPGQVRPPSLATPTARPAAPNLPAARMLPYQSDPRQTPDAFAPAPPFNLAGAAPPDGRGAQDGDASGTAIGRQTGLGTERARASTLANRSTTVPQGTLIPAVLETAFDSTSPGFARALVQKDVRGFDGSRVLIPRGSRLIGEYGADAARGQKRAVILWSRLIRPDGVTIAIGSPAADTQGRGGVKADVDTHFIERFSGAILQSVLDVGVALAARSSRSPVIVALPGSATGITSSVNNRTADVVPTLKVPAARSVSVFVARDLDFTQVEERP